MLQKINSVLCFLVHMLEGIFEGWYSSTCHSCRLTFLCCILNLVILHVVVNQGGWVHDFVLLRDSQLGSGHELIGDRTLNFATHGRLATIWQDISGNNRLHVAILRDMTVHVRHLAQICSEALLVACHVAILASVHQVLALLTVETGILLWHLVMTFCANHYSSVHLLTVVGDSRLALPWRALPAEVLLGALV